MEGEFNIGKFKEKMERCVDNLISEYGTIRAGRANPAILSKVRVEYYGTLTPIEQIAAVSVSEARVLVINPWDITALPLIEKAIQQSDIGINPTNDGKVIRLTFPQITQEGRKEIVKQVHKLKENAKVTVRNIRKDALDLIKSLKKEGVFSEDDVKNKEKKVQNLVDEFNGKIDTIAQNKEKEVMEV